MILPFGRRNVMKKLSVIFTTLGMLIALNVAVADTISIRADEWYPVNGEPGSEKEGFMIEIAKAVFEKAGHTVNYKVLPWERSIDEVRKGKYNCVVGAAVGDAEDFAFPSVPMGMSSTNFYKKTGKAIAVSDIDSLKGLKIGAITGYSYGDDLDQFFESSSNVQFIGGNNSLENNIKKLLAGRIDLVVESPMIMNDKLKEMNAVNKVENAGSYGEYDPLYVACNTQSQKYVDLLSQGVQEMMDNGELEVILNKYSIDKWW